MAVVVLAALLAMPGHVAAQTVAGLVRHRGSGEPLSGILVTVSDQEGERVRSVLTDAAGRFSIDLPTGQYRVRAERIGLSSASLEGLDLEDGERLFRVLEMDERPVELEGIVVDSRVRTCRTEPRQASRAQRWWSEIRTALEVSAALQEERFGQFIITTFRRVLDAESDLIATRRDWTVSASTRPFSSVPAEELLDEGFVVGPYGPQRIYHGPDAQVLLSTDFLNAHCFSIDGSRGDRDQLGIGFEPIEERPVVDISGTFWVDTTTAELTKLDFRYENLSGPEGPGAGGHVAFDYLPSGAWIVTDWLIRIPQTGRRRGSDDLSTIGFFEGGGSATQLEPAPAGDAVGSVSGIVEDRIHGGVLAGAVVGVLGTDQRAVSDAGGRFRIAEVPAGERFLALQHEDLTLWNLESEPTKIDVAAGEAADVALTTPSFDEAARALCLGGGVGAESIVVGLVSGPDGRPLQATAMQLVYETRTGASGSLAYASTATDDDGRFAVCSVPGGRDVTVRARRRGEWTDVATLQATERDITYKEIGLGEALGFE